MGLKIGGEDPPTSSTADGNGNGSSNGEGKRGGRRGSITKTVLATLEAEAREQSKLESSEARKARLILPNSTFLYFWLAIISPLIVYNVIWVPLEVSQMACASQIHGRVDFILDFFFYLDILVNFRTAFINKENELVLDQWVVAKRYLYGSFLIDLFATMQWETLFTGQTAFSRNGCDAGSGAAAFAILRLPRLLRLLRLFKKLDMFPGLKVLKLIFLLGMVAHWVGCMWFWIGFASIGLNLVPNPTNPDSVALMLEGISPTGILSHQPMFDQYYTKEFAFGDSWIIRHFGSKDINGDWKSAGYTPDPRNSIARLAGGNSTRKIISEIGVEQIYFTAIYWSFTMLMKSPHIGPDTWIEKFFSCLMVLLGLFVTTQLVAVVTQVVMSFDKAHSAFRDRQQEYTRFAFSRSLPSGLRRKLLGYSLQDWGVNQGFDPFDVIKQLKLPPALTHQMLAAAYDDMIQDSPLLRVFETPVVHELLRYFKLVVSLQKETLINQSDPCTRFYLLRAGSLQASATDKLMREMQKGGDQAAAAAPGKSKLNRQSSTWKAKMQVRMIERPGDVICCASPFDPPQPLPFQVTSLKRTTLIVVHMKDLLTILDIVSEKQVDSVCKAMQAEHRNILLSVMPKTKEKAANSPDVPGNLRTSARFEDVPAVVESPRDPSSAPGPDADFSEERLSALERDIDKCISAMAALHTQAAQIPRIVQELSRRHGKPMQPMGAAAMAALKGGGGGANGMEAASNSDAELDALKKEVEPDL